MILLGGGTLLLSRKTVVDEPGMRWQELDCFWRWPWRKMAGKRGRFQSLFLSMESTNLGVQEQASLVVFYSSLFWPSSRFSSLTYRALAKDVQMLSTPAAILSHINYQSRMYLPRADDVFYGCEIR